MILLCFKENFKCIFSISNNSCLCFQVSTRETVVENNTEGTVSNRICNFLVLVNAQSCMYVVKKYTQHLVRFEFLSLCVNKSKVFICKAFYYKEKCKVFVIVLLLFRMFDGLAEILIANGITRKMCF